MAKKVTKMQKYDIIIEALLTTNSIKAAAEKAGVSTKTLYKNYLDDPAFLAEYRRVRDERQRALVLKLAHYASRALDVLIEVAENKKAAPHARVAAARGVVEQAMKIHEVVKVEELEERLKELEQAENIQEVGNA